MSVGVDVDIVRVGSTPLEMFVVALWLSVVGTAVVTVATQALLPVLRRRWPAVERLDPVEMLWAEAGGHVQRTFQGLDVESAREIAAHSIEARVPAGELIVEQGDAPIYFYILRDGEAEVSQRDDESGEEHVVRTFAAGDSFGEVAIVERTARTASVRARTDCVVLQIPAEDFVAAVSGGDDLAVDFHEVAAQYRAEDRSRRAAPADPAPPAAPAEAGRAYGVAHSATPYAHPGDEPAAPSPPSSEAEELSPEEEA
ncbi:MAG TPA: cyclic nucleotide-binding domain-containing protein, partial [Acidimicrobiia bacterium]|nr:cyclic nucleotide-binding domain-containing protein [Acidimicrobiia bacterium]